MGLEKGDYIVILNLDDIYAEDRLEELVALQQESNAAHLFTDVIPISYAGTVFTDPDFGWNVWHRENTDWYFVCRDLYTAFLKGNFMVATFNLFMMAEAVQWGGFFSLRNIQDYGYILQGDVGLSRPGTLCSW